MKRQIMDQERNVEHRLSEAARRKVAAGFRAEASNPKWPPAERAEFVRMAEAWERTLTHPQKK